MSGEKIDSKKIVEQVIQNVLTQNEDENECKLSISTNTFAMRIVHLYLASMTLEEMEKQQKEADAVLGASDADNCSYSNGTVKPIIDSQFTRYNSGYVTRQALYSCLTCTVDGEMAGVCLACSLTCHKGEV